MGHLNMKLVLKNFLNYFQVYLKEIVNGLFLMMYQNLEIWMMILNLFLTFMNFGENSLLGKEEQEKEKLRKKAERKAAKIRRREEANREAREEQEKKEAEAKAIEEKKENEAKQRAIENKQIRKKRPQLRKICRLAREEHDSDPINNPFNPLEEHVEILCKEMNLKQFNVLIKSLQNENGPSSFRNMIIEYNVITPDDSYGL